MKSVGLVALLLAGSLGCGERQFASLYVRQKAESPQKRMVAVFYIWNPGGESGFLGATVSQPLYVGIHRVGMPLEPEKDQVFAMKHAYQVHLNWKSDQELEIDYPEGADIYKKESERFGITISYRPRKKTEFRQL